MRQPSSAANIQIQEIAAKIQQDASTISDFEAKFVSDQMARIDQYGDDTYFSEKQIVLIEKIHAERVRGEKFEKPKSKTKAKSNEQ